MLAVTCPHCHYSLRLVDELRGKEVSCIKCKGRFRLSPELGSEEPKLAPINVAIPPAKARDPLPRRLIVEEVDEPDSLRTVRLVAWIICGLVCLISFCNFQNSTHGWRDVSAFQQAGAAGEALVLIAFASVIAFAIDRCTRR